MLQTQIVKQAKQYFTSNNVVGVRNILSDGDQLTSDTISEILNLAVSHGQYELVQEICTMNNTNTPNESAIKKTLQAFFINNKLKEFSAVCEKSIAKPSQEAIESILKLAHTSNHSNNWSCKWEFVDYICFLDVPLNPSIPAIDDAVKAAADCNEETLVAKLIKMKGNNKPSQPAVEYALKKAFERKKLNNFILICQDAVNKPSQEAIESILKLAHTSNHSNNWSCKWEFVDYICFLDVPLNPSIPAIDDAVKAAADCNEETLVAKLIKMKGNNKPSQPAVEYALKKAFERKKLNNFILICQDAVNKPSQEAIESILKLAHTSNHSNNWSCKWEFVDYICFLDVPLNPSIPAIDDAVKAAADCNEETLVAKLIKMKGNNKPSQPAVEYALKKAFERKKLNNFIFICQDAVNKPSQETIESILKLAHTSNHSNNWSCKWDFVDYICFLDVPLNPSIPAIDDALKGAAGPNWSLAEKIITMKDVNNKPSQAAIEHVLTKAAQRKQLVIIEIILKLPIDQCPRAPAVGHAFVEAAESNFLQGVTYLCQLKSENRLNQQFIGRGIKAAASADRLEVVKFLLSNDNPIKPESKDIIDAFLGAAATNSFAVVDYFCEFRSEHQIDQKILDEALIVAFTKGSFTIVELLLKHDNPIKFTPQIVAKAFVSAISSGSKWVMDYFINPKNNLELDSKMVENELAIKLATIKATYNKVGLIRDFIEINNVRKILSELGTGDRDIQAFIEAHAEVTDNNSTPTSVQDAKIQQDKIASTNSSVKKQQAMTSPTQNIKMKEEKAQEVQKTVKNEAGAKHKAEEQTNKYAVKKAEAKRAQEDAERKVADEKVKQAAAEAKKAQEKSAELKANQTRPQATSAGAQVSEDEEKAKQAAAEAKAKKAQEKAERKEQKAHKEKKLGEALQPALPKETYEKYIKDLLSTTQTCIDNLTVNEENQPIHVILDRLKGQLTKKPCEATIRGFYTILGETAPGQEPGKEKNNLQIIEQNKERSTARFIAGIVAITAILVTGVIPGLIAMAVVYSLKSKTPMTFFKSYTGVFQEDTKILENEFNKDIQSTKSSKM